MRSLRIFPLLTADGPTQMAWDEALLETAAAPTLRLYTWAPATVSLGYFQDAAAVRAALPTSRSGMPLVRRITGGGAIWHEHEVTYALVGVLGRDGWPTRARDLYPLLHGAVAAALMAHQAQVALQPESVGDRRYAQEVRCFASPAADDLMAGTGKALGSAARARGDRVLIHGSLKLASNPWDGATVAGCGVDAITAAQVLRTAFARALGADFVEDIPTEVELAAQHHLKDLRYGTDAWVETRTGPRP